MVVTLLHGFMQDGRAWDQLVARLPAEWTYQRPALAGLGSLPEVAEQVGEGSHLVGYSMGGRLALWLAAQHPERVLSLTTIGAHAGLEPAERAARAAADEALAARVEREGMEWFAGYWAAQPMFARLAGRADLDAMRREQDTAATAAMLRGLGPAAVEPFWDRLPAITASALFIAGAEDGRYPELARRLAAAVPHGRAEVVPGAGHAVHLENPDAVARLLRAHLSSR